MEGASKTFCHSVHSVGSFKMVSVIKTKPEMLALFSLQ